MKDFFISYTKSDVNWAEWIANELEKAGYLTIIQAWDFPAGSNFVMDMNQALEKSKRTISVLSPEYASSEFALAEYNATYAKDPLGKDKLLVPVRVEDIDVFTLFKTITYIDLVGLEEDEAREKLITAIDVVVNNKRAKTKTKYPFPNKTSTSDNSIDNKVIFKKSTQKKEEFIKGWDVLEVNDKNNEITIVLKIDETRIISIQTITNESNDKANFVLRKKENLFQSEKSIIDLEKSKKIENTAKDNDEKYHELVVNKCDLNREYTPDKDLAFVNSISHNKKVLSSLATSSKLSICLSTKLLTYPWEELPNNTSDTENSPPAVRTGLVRQVIDQQYNKEDIKLKKNKLLIISSPKNHLPELKSAIIESNLIHKIFDQKGIESKILTNSSLVSSINAVFNENMNILHLSGYLDYAKHQRVGLLISDAMYLTSSELSQLQNKPEVVFINCGFREGGSITERTKTENLYLSAQLSQELSDIGVKIIIICAEPIKNEAGIEFSYCFYDKLLSGETFGDAVIASRQLIYKKYPNEINWASYQCYGNPIYKLPYIS